jgi:signal transduction histidine kinase/CheY-like chemotaxis protein
LIEGKGNPIPGVEVASSELAMTRRRWLRSRYALHFAALFSAYVVSGVLGLKLSALAGAATLVWFPTGIALAGLFGWGIALWPAVTAGALLVNLCQGDHILVALSIAAGNTLEAVVASVALRRVAGGHNPLGRLRFVAWLLTFAALAATAISASIGVSSLVLAGVVTFAQFAETWLRWWVGDAVSVMLVAPLLMAWLGSRIDVPTSRGRWVELLTLLLLTTTIAATVFVLGPSPPLRPYLLFPPLLWASLRFGPKGATALSFVVTASPVWGAVHRSGAFNDSSSVGGLLTFEAYTALVAATGLLLAAFMAERIQAEKALREANRRKDEFLGMLAHELRNPLAPIHNSMYLLRRAPPGSEQARRAQEVIERQARHLARLVDDLLDVNRIERGKIELRRERVDLREVVLRAAEDFRPTMDQCGVEFCTKLPDAKLWVDVDAARVAQIVGNLLHNASKFTLRGGKVVLSLVAVGDDAEIRVRDTGVGIEPMVLSRLFEPFVQADQSLARTQGGLGLGLALVKRMAELHGGSARAESAGSGKGAEFIVRLPLVPLHPVDRADAATPRVANGGRRVLVVDDNRDSAESLAEIVRSLGHSAKVAFDGPSAIEYVRRESPDVVLCDIGLPGISGYEVARAIRAEASTIKLVAVSGYAQPEDVKKAVEAGFDAHVAKPPDITVLERLLG